MTDTIKLGDDEFEFYIPQGVLSDYLKKRKIALLDLGAYLLQEIEIQPFVLISKGINGGDKDAKMTPEKVQKLVGHKVVGWMKLVVYIQDYYGIIGADDAQELMSAADKGIEAFMAANESITKDKSASADPK